jgi:hypothetical protein
MLKLIPLAAYYHDKFPNDPVLQLNDASLVRGGLFDIYSWVDENGVVHTRSTDPWWTPAHKGHRKGLIIDIQANGTNTAIPQRNFIAFEDLMQRLGITANRENLNQSGGHYHVRLLGIEQ